MTITKGTPPEAVWNPNPGQPIEDGWGDNVAASVIQRFLGMGANGVLNPPWPDPPLGAFAQTLDNLMVFQWDGAEWCAFGNPTGTIIDVVGPCPPGYLECDGRPIPSTKQSLIKYLTDAGLDATKTPNLIGRSTAGIGDFASAGLGVGSFSVGQQYGAAAAAVVPHQHDLQNHAHIADPPNTIVNYPHGLKPFLTVPGVHASEAVLANVQTPGFYTRYSDTEGYVDVPAFWTSGPNVNSTGFATGQEAAANRNYHPIMGVRKCIKT